MNTDTKTRKVSASKNQIREAEILGRVRGVGFGDAMHVVFARDSNAILITRDKHFIDFTDIATIRKPEELI
jgi:predicted nucleic acid-binding protein